MNPEALLLPILGQEAYMYKLVTVVGLALIVASMVGAPYVFLMGLALVLVGVLIVIYRDSLRFPEVR